MYAASSQHVIQDLPVTTPIDALVESLSAVQHLVLDFAQ
jgi:hypothetical protein